MTQAIASPPPGVPVLDIDPFDYPFFDDPYPRMEEMREAGPVVWLSRYGCMALARHAEVYEVLRDWERFTSARGVGLVDYAKDARFRPKSLILEIDPPIHTRTRSAMMKVLSPRVMRQLRENFAVQAELLVDRLIEMGSFDGVTDLAEQFPLTVFPDALGMKREGRDNLLPVGALVFNSYGPENEIFLASKPLAEKGFAWLEMQCKRENLCEGGFGKAMFDLVDQGQLDEREGEVTVRAMLMAGVDTTVNGIGGAIYALCSNPEQYDLLHADPTLARSAFEEAVRWMSPAQSFFRTSAVDTEISGVPVAEGTKVFTLMASANRDPRRWDEPDRYDIRRNSVGHLGFGSGIHMCVGQNLARLEGELVLAALARRVRAMELTALPTLRYNNTLRGYATMPMRIISK
ncbi:cytochrome P450 [Novosphingobium endophyticum]|uniref:Cytochrome P450 n=1 Tax=Novosphingobium endophyticum TaxID=1955250 RepID=A0A916X5X4_9SPHN|nr:cytochrome P450 [Novosphingobium endophyticum]GGC01213.1 cytochrome P450 [Novosphingobium endophyticum]